MKRIKRCLAIMLVLQIGSCSAAFTENPEERIVESESVGLCTEPSADEPEQDMPAWIDDTADDPAEPAEEAASELTSAGNGPEDGFETGDPAAHELSGTEAASEDDASAASGEDLLPQDPVKEENAADNSEEAEPEATEQEVPEEAQPLLSGLADEEEAVPAEAGEEIPAAEVKTPAEEETPAAEEMTPAEKEMPAEGEDAPAEEAFPVEEKEASAEEETGEEKENSSGQFRLAGDEILVVTQVITEGTPGETGESKTETTGSEAAEELTGAARYGDILVSDVSVSAVATNPRYSKLVFSFTDETTNQTYRCLMTGLKASEENTAEGYNRLAYDVAVNFLSGQTLPLSAERMANRYGLEIELIDAEKQDAHTGADTSLCWAASAADMIELAGWNVYDSEDEAFADLSASFNNLGGTQQMAIKWFVDGINPRQLTAEEGRILYQNTTSGAAQQLAEGTGGYWRQYAAPAVSPDNGAYDEIETLLTDGMQKLEQGYALGIGVFTYKDRVNQGMGHSLTVFGYIGELLNQTIRRISALFVADSDNDAYGQSTPPSERRNSYTMYRLRDYSNGNFDSLELSGYKDAEDTHVVIGTVTSMAPRQTAPSETAGTRNPQQSVNLVPVSMEIMNSARQEITEANAGDTISLSLEITNESYTRLPENAVAEVTIHATRNGTRLADTTGQVRLNGMDPLESLSSSFSYDVLAPGNYTFRMEITSVKDASGNPVPEAYLSDNLLQKTKQIVVYAVQPRIGPETEAPAQNIAPAGQPPLAIGTAEKIYKLQVVLGDETTYLTDFSAPVSTQAAFLDLRALKTREIVDPKNYQISMKNGKFQLKFAELFLRTLKPGNNDFELLFDGGRILFRIIIL